MDPRELLRRLDLLEHEAAEIAAAGLRPGEAAEITGPAGRRRSTARRSRPGRSRSARRSSARDAGRGSRSPAPSRSCGRWPASTGAGGRSRTGWPASRPRWRTWRPRRARSPRPWTTTRRRSRGSRSGWARSTACCGGTATTRRRSSSTASGRRPRRSGCAGSRTSAPAGAAEDARLLLEVADAAASLSIRRAETGSGLAASVGAVLAELGFPADAFDVALGRRPAARDDPAVEVDGDAVAFDATGIDTVVFTFRPNPGEPARPLARIASGGELSRVALAVKQVLAEVDDTPTLVFDEIDTGIGGPERGSGRAQPVDAGPRPPGAVRHPPAPDRRLRRRALPDREARARRPDRDRRHAARPRPSARRSWPR